MSVKSKGKWLGGVLVLGALACTGWFLLPGGRMNALGRRLGEGVAKVMKSSDSGAGSPVIVLQETHESRLQQVEQAIVLTRALCGEITSARSSSRVT